MKHMIELVHRDIKRFNNYVLYFQDGRGKHEHAQVKHQRFFLKKKATTDWTYRAEKNVWKENILDDSNSRLDTAEEKMSELEDIAIVHILKEMQREKRLG